MATWHSFGSSSSRRNGASGTRRSTDRAWEHVIPFFALAAGIRKMIYTITAVETQRRSLRKIKPRAFGTPLRGLGA